MTTRPKIVNVNGTWYDLVDVSKTPRGVQEFMLGAVAAQPPAEDRLDGLITVEAPDPEVFAEFVRRWNATHPDGRGATIGWRANIVQRPWWRRLWPRR